MAKKKKLPLVAICGRPNVGKSTLFNRITRKASAIVHDQEGITRDRAYGEAEWHNRKFRVVDTGGITDKAQDSITQKMQQQVREALKEARAIVFVVDGQAELTRMDHEVCQELFTYGKPVILAVNKLDNDNMTNNRYDFFSLGMGEPYAISSGHGRGVPEMMKAVVAHLPEPAATEEDEAPEAQAETAETETEPDTPEAGKPKAPEKSVIKVAIVGKPNVGKSSFINALLNEERNIVDATPGTTRDAIDIDFHWQGKDYLLIDTAGMRRKAGITESVELFSVARSLRAVRRADVCLIMIDANDGMSEQDKRIIGYCLEAGTAMILVWTKWDLVEKREAYFKKLKDDLDRMMPQIHFVPSLTVSNVTRQRIYTVFEYIDRIAVESERRIPTAELNKLLAEIKAKHPPPSDHGRAAKLKYITQTNVKPTTFVIFCNAARLVHFSYQRYIENQIREHYAFEGVPILLELREGEAKPPAKPGEKPPTAPGAKPPAKPKPKPKATLPVKPSAKSSAKTKAKKP